MNEGSLQGFLDRLASAAPAPAAGAAAALTGALSAAIVAMVCRVTAQRGAPSTALAQGEQEAEALRARLMTLVQEDSDAYTAVIAARREADERRAAAMRAALVRATEIPVEISQAASRLLALCDRLGPSARASTVSDLGVAATLAAAAFEGAALTARVNLRDLGDAAFVARTRAMLGRLADDAAVTRQRLAELVATRTGIPA